MATFPERLERYRRASRDTFNAHFLPYVETERDYEVFSTVDAAMFQVLVLDHIGVGRRTAREAVPELKLQVRRTSAEGALQGDVAETILFDETCRFAFVEFIDFGEDWSAKELDFVMTEVLGCPDPRLVGRRTIFRYSDISLVES